MQIVEPELPDELQSKVAEPNPKNTKSQKLYDCLSIIVCVALLCVFLSYATVSDSHPVGEFLTIWPPILYLIPSVIILGVFSWRSSPRVRWLSLSIVLLFFATLIEWGSLFRFSKSNGDLTVVSWNIGGGYSSERDLLNTLAPHQPDFIFLQESPDGADAFNSETLTGPFEGYFYYDQGDCATLSRWPCTILKSKSVGPWEAPQLLMTEIQGERVLLVNVRLMLPSLILNPLDASSREKLWADNQTRRAQFPALVELIKTTQKEHAIKHVILAGDFNTDASAKSLNVLRNELADVWKTSGIGWGGTAINSFPVARIDHVYVSGFTAVSAWVLKTPLSDHRPLAATLRFVPNPIIIPNFP